LQRDGTWSQESSFRIPLIDNYRYADLTSDGTVVIGDYQNATTPPEIFRYLRGAMTAMIIARLNPQFDQLTLAPAQTIQWQTSTGFGVEGFLFTPPGTIRETLSSGHPDEA
jgi:dipeptidyl aminopeptidase/acylaminoacyl peptidase